MQRSPSKIERRAGVARGQRGVVASGHAAATDAAIAVLARGGNAVDAAVCAAFVLCVVLPYACSLGGDVFALVHEPGGARPHGLNGSGRSAHAALAERFPDGAPRSGITATTVPALVRALDDLRRRWGTFAWAALLGPALRLAEDGFPVHETLAANTRERRELLARDAAASALFLPGGEPLQFGATFRQPGLARVLRALSAEGADAFYTGGLAAELVAASAVGGGLLAAADLAEHASLWQTPLAEPFAGYDVWTMPPNSYGPTLAVQLRELEAAEIASYEPGSAAFVARGYAARRSAYRSVGGTIADPGCTTNVVAIDERGLAVSLIESISAPYGAGVVLGATGIVLNNRMAGFSDDPASRNALAPAKRPANTLAPALVTRDGRLAMTLGTPGTVGQTCTLAQYLARTLACGEDVATAVEAPRWSVDFQGRPIVEDTFDPAVRDAVAAQLPDLRSMPEGWISFGSIKLAMPTADGFVGVADFRRAATAAGLSSPHEEFACPT